MHNGILVIASSVFLWSNWYAKLVVALLLEFKKRLNPSLAETFGISLAVGLAGWAPSSGL